MSLPAKTNYEYYPMPQLQAEIISIGDELTSGQRLDTNSQWISQQLGAIGVRVMYHSTVADDLEANIDVFRQAIDSRPGRLNRWLRPNSRRPNKTVACFCNRRGII